ncbi:unnamed protein product [Phaedon cochleariae]|uniref:Uncharacterized protein n=1 Tax=Phaedon cochleariae TaxID=80249 RepID=A0A9P0DTP3_PHACE|nr:unnamed protein product [Phaedon cochleariae]
MQISLYLLAFLAISETQQREYGNRNRRLSFQSSYPSESSNLQIGGIDVDSYGKTAELPAQDSYPYSTGVGKFLPFHQYTHPDISFEADIEPNLRSQQLHRLPRIQSASSNAVDKPVQESQEYVPPQAAGTAVIPGMPPPATPVSAAAANVPGNGGAVFLGSGSLGVIDLGGGAYALGSGGLGYSDTRQNPRPSIRSPALPPIGADPNLVPAAVNTPQQDPSFVLHDYPLSADQPSQTDQNGYEFLRPDRVGFGDPLPIRPLKTTNTYATPTNLLIRPQSPSYQQPDIYHQLYGQSNAGLYSSSFLKK